MGSQQKGGWYWAVALGLPATAATVGIFYYWQTRGKAVTPAEQRGRSANYGTFLKREPANQKASEAVTAPKAAAAAGPEEDQIPLMVLVGTEYGFAEEVAEKLCQGLQAGLPQYWCAFLFWLIGSKAQPGDVRLLHPKS